MIGDTSGGSRPSDNGGGGGVHPRLEIREGGGGRPPKKFFSALRASFWSKNKGGPGPSPGSATVYSKRLGGKLKVHCTPGQVTPTGPSCLKASG